MTTTDKDETYKKLVRKQKIGMFFAKSVVKRRRTLRDKFLVAIFNRLMPKSDPATHFMRDEICDAEPEFSVEELRAFQNGE